MKLIIDIDDKDMDKIRQSDKAIFYDVYRMMANIIQHGIPLDDVLDKIRAEINQYGSIWVQYTIKGHTDKDIEDIIEDVLRQAKEQVLSVIDKYRNEVSE